MKSHFFSQDFRKKCQKIVKFSKRYKAETYRTDVAVYEEGTAFQDPELEAKFKKEYFM